MNPIGGLPRRILFPLCVVGVLMQIGAPRMAQGQVSPGKLAEAHHEFEGSKNCNQCHSGNREAMDANCLACHGEIAGLKTAGRGLHARLRGKACASCHPDHAGFDFELIYWEEGSEEAFDHERTGWSLRGKHDPVKCAACHQAKFQDAEFVAGMKRKKIGESWLGLQAACQSCHQDAHRGTLGLDCARCHDNAGWIPAPKFDHAAGAFPLTGRHLSAKCETCHPLAPAPKKEVAASPALRTRIFSPLAHDDCFSCHKDVHGGKFGAKCAGCHNTESFKEIDRESFDHDLTRYPLRGRHTSVACVACHNPAAGGGSRPSFDRCASCHSDPHAGKATLKGLTADCAACHTVKGFTPSSYTVKSHAVAAYPLTGKHTRVACRACHQTNAAAADSVVLGTARIDFRPRADQCRDCHADPHGGQLDNRESKGMCEACHTVSGFKPSTYTVEKHASLALDLDGKHGDIECSACHGPSRPGLPASPGVSVVGTAGVWLTVDSSACTGCHLDAHEGRLPAKTDVADREQCLLCHNTRRFSPSTMDEESHGEMSFPLEGAHRVVPCVTCHPALARPHAQSTLLVSGVVASLPFSQSRATCRDCHTGPHGDQFNSSRGHGACRSCHGTEAFRPASVFDHNRDASFSLEGAHALVPCTSCHLSRVDSLGKTQVLYRPLDGSCENCHRRGIPVPDSGNLNLPQLGHAETGGGR